MNIEIILKVVGLVATIVIVAVGAAFGYGSLTNQVSSNRELVKAELSAVNQKIEHSSQITNAKIDNLADNLEDYIEEQQASRIGLNVGTEAGPTALIGLPLQR